MLIDRNPLTLQVEEIFTDSELTPDVTCLLLNGLDEYFTKHILAYSADLPEIVSMLYAIDDNNMYTVISVCGVSGYEAVLVPALQNLIKESSFETISYLKTCGKYKGKELQAEISKVTTLLKTVLVLLRDSTRTSRRAIGVSEKEIEFPDYEVMRVFYECGRKVSYKSREEGQANLFSENNVYLCVHCNNYHQGRLSVYSAPPVAEEVILGRYKTAWRRYNKI